jgi:hypothetical protein
MCKVNDKYPAYGFWKEVWEDLNTSTLKLIT